MSLRRKFVSSKVEVGNLAESQSVSQSDSTVSTVLYVPDSAEHRSADSNQQSLTKDKTLHRIIKRTNSDSTG